MLTLYCVVVGEGRPFPVEIDAEKTVGILKDKIKEKKPQSITCEADRLELYMALKDGAWIGSKSSIVREMKKGVVRDTVKELIHEDMELDPADTIGTFFVGEQEEKKPEIGARQIHVLVVVPSGKVTALEESKEDVEKLPITRKRWAELNKVLDVQKKMKMLDGIIAYSDLSWTMVEPIFEEYTIPYRPPKKEIDLNEMDGLYSCLLRFTKTFGRIFSGKEAKRLFFIAPILAYVSYLFGGNVQVLVEENVVGEKVHTNGRFEFVLRRGSKRICIVEAKKDDMDQGLAQNLVGCEALADVEQLDVVYGIVTNYTQWIFFKSEKDWIHQHNTTIQLDQDDLPAQESLRNIAEIIYGILSDDNESNNE
ncbi:Aste57867_24230 [Aphanomyces stellatus]|uniref:Aste57867_24230 protein n=2 Tax=Aphanomyces stellatus TaxID=120398 RepID=A0A485LQ36_9STRA|nr:hypothetical protein As57867_024155 [Aphanomyces stellatus]VFU00871.1 Aste57867_24230 [Aphanomyces stellatus]